MVAELATGELAVVDEREERQVFAVTAGLLEVAWDAVTILVDAAEGSGEIDVARARAAQQRARQRLRSRSAGVNATRAEAALVRAVNRLRVAAKRRRPG